MKQTYTFEHIRLNVKKTNSPWALFVIDPLAIRLTWLLANFTKLSPNTVTLISLLLGVISAALFYLGEYRTTILAVVCFQLSLLLDSVDGKLARLQNKESEFGRKFDFFRDKFIHTLTLIALCYGYYLQNNNWKIFFIGGLYYFCLFFYWITYKSSYTKKLKANIFLTSFDTMAIVFFFAPLLNQIVIGLAIAGTLLFMLVLYYMFVRVLRRGIRL